MARNPPTALILVLSYTKHVWIKMLHNCYESFHLRDSPQVYCPTDDRSIALFQARSLLSHQNTPLPSSQCNAASPLHPQPPPPSPPRPTTSIFDLLPAPRSLQSSMQNRRNVATFISGQRNIPRQEEFNCCTALRRRRPFQLVSWEVRITWIVTYVCVARCMCSILAFGACCLLLWLAGSGCSPKGVI